MALLEKSMQVLREDGMKTFLLKVTDYVRKRLEGRCNESAYEIAQKMYSDVLFVNGCCLPHPHRYRVTHQREQLFAYGVESHEIYYTEVQPDLVDHFRTFVIYRCPMTEQVKELVRLAKHYNKSVLFDIDDLVIDTKYTDLIPYVKNMKPEDKKTYDYGVNSYREMMLLCDGVITTTTALAEELGHYMQNVFINRNTVSEGMVGFSQEALKKRKPDESVVKLGYFSGSITHNSDFAMILPILCRLMDKYANLQLHIVGELDVPRELEPYKKRIIALPFVDWTKLPDLIAAVDINLAPLTDTIFNAAKSENKWLEAALVKVPTVASKLGAFAEMMRNNENGCLCETADEWQTALESLITDPARRAALGETAQQFVLENCVTTTAGKQFAAYIQKQQRPNIAFVLPSLNISGGILVAFRHCEILHHAGYDAFLINGAARLPEHHVCAFYNGARLSTVALNKYIIGKIDKAVATMWVTTDFFKQRGDIAEKYYLVQNFETDFYGWGTSERALANRTYCQGAEIKYITISHWCRQWLADKFGKTAGYAPNGLERTLFFSQPRDFSGKIRILIEGDSASPYKNVDEAFRIVAELDPEKYEIWYMSYNGKSKSCYRVDRFLHKVPYEKVAEVYRACHILLKTSILESFSYPPLEMMATGGYVVACPNGGNLEYLEDGENCMLYPAGDLTAARACIEKICNDAQLRQTLVAGGGKTADLRDWDGLEEKIVALYKGEGSK